MDSLPFLGHGMNIMAVGCRVVLACITHFLSGSGHVLLRFFSEAPKAGAPISTTAVVFPKESDTAEPWSFTESNDVEATNLTKVTHLNFAVAHLTSG